MMRTPGSLLLLVLALLLPFLATGCSLFASSRQIVTIQATDPAAEIWVDGNLVGTGTVTTSLWRRRSHQVVARAGDRTGTAQIDRELSGTAVLDLVGGVLFLFPLIGVFGGGFWRLDTNHVVIGLPPAHP